jgi:hypothetical protein
LLNGTLRCRISQTKTSATTAAPVTTTADLPNEWRFRGNDGASTNWFELLLLGAA